MATTMAMKFILSGGIAAGVNIGARYILSTFLPYGYAIVLAYIAGMITAFLLFKVLVFNAGASRRTVKESIWFVVINLAALGQTLLVSIGLSGYVFPWLGLAWHSQDIAHIIGVIVPVASSFFGHKYLTFHS